MLDVKKFYYIDCKGLFFCITLKDFPYGPLPIIWYNQGLYGIIPIAIVTNAIECLKNTKKVFKDDNIDGVFTSGQTIEIPQEIGDQLTNKQFNHQTDSDEG